MIKPRSDSSLRPSFDGAHVLILGGTGSLGQRLCHRIISDEMGHPADITILSRDEAKQHYMRLDFQHNESATDEVIYRDRLNRLRFVIGDVRDHTDLRRAVDRADIIFHAAALKQVPTCEYSGPAAVDTNIYGAINLCRAIRESGRTRKTVVGISTDKACKPVNLMGMTKAIQERIMIQANLDSDWVDFLNVRYGNVMASRGSAIPFFIDLIRRGRPVTITDPQMTRFLMTLDQAVDLIFSAYRHAVRGETLLPIVPSARVSDLAAAISGKRDYPTEISGVRPGEKLHEILVSEEEVGRTTLLNNELVIQPILPELRADRNLGTGPLPFSGEFSSSLDPISYEELRQLLTSHQLTTETAPVGEEIYK